MTRKGNAKPGHWVRRPEAICRSFMIQALRHATAAAPSVTVAARWIGRPPATLRRWLAGTSRPDLRALMTHRKFWRMFRICLMRIEHEAGYR
jgi:hypothetical protein